MANRLKIVVLFCSLFLTCTEEPEDSAGPEVQIVWPENNTEIKGIVTIKIQSSEMERITKVELLVDGVQTDVSSDSLPFDLVWDTTPYPDSTYVITVRSFDEKGTYNTSEAVAVTIHNDPDWTIYNHENSVLPERGVVHLTSCENGDIWAAHFYRELYRFNGTGWEEVTVISDNYTAGGVWALDCYNDTLWVALSELMGNNSILKIFEGEITEYGLYDEPRSFGMLLRLKVRPENVVWFVSGYSDLGKLEGGSFTYWYSAGEWTDSTTALDGDDSQLGNVDFDSQGNVWIAGSERMYKPVVARLKQDGWDIFNIPITSRVWDMTFDKNGSIQVLLYYGALLTFRPDHSWTVVDIPTDLTYIYYYNRIKVDNNNDIFISTKDGIYKYDSEEWKLFYPDELNFAFGNFSAMLFDGENRCWIAATYADFVDSTKGGVIILDNH